MNYYLAKKFETHSIPKGYTSKVEVLVFQFSIPRNDMSTLTVQTLSKQTNAHL